MKKMDKSCENCKHIRVDEDDFPCSECNLNYGKEDMFVPNAGEPEIKDSGNRRKFETGAVRDIQEGKGRCDLMPLDIVSQCMADSVLYSIYEFQTDRKEYHLREAIKIFGLKRNWNEPAMFLELAVHFEQGAKKYGENNWQKGIPVECYIDSAVRHYLKWLRGDNDERHDRAFVWNIMCCIWEVNHHGNGGDYE